MLSRTSCAPPDAQLAYLHQHSAPNAGRIYQLSTSTRQEFPLAIVSINITKFMLQVRREHSTCPCPGVHLDAASLALTMLPLCCCCLC